MLVINIISLLILYFQPLQPDIFTQLIITCHSHTKINNRYFCDFFSLICTKNTFIPCEYPLAVAVL